METAGCPRLPRPAYTIATPSSRMSSPAPVTPRATGTTWLMAPPTLTSALTPDEPSVFMRTTRHRPCGRCRAGTVRVVAPERAVLEVGSALREKGLDRRGEAVDLVLAERQRER